MTNKEAREAWEKLYSEIDKDNWLFVGTINPEMVTLAIKALEVVDKIKQSYVTSYKNLLGNLENGFTEEMATPVFYQDVAYCINNILCDAYDTEEMMSWLKETEK